MWLLLDELRELGASGSITGGERVLRGARLFPCSEAISADTVCIGSADGLAGGLNEVWLTHGDDIIRVPNASVADVFNRVLYIFERYLLWSTRLRDALHGENPFQAIIDVAHELIPAPMFFGQRNLRILAITHCYSREEVFDEWDEMKSSGTIPMRMLERLKKYNFWLQYPEETDLAVIPALEEYGFSYYHTIYANCRSQGQIWGQLYCYYLQRELSPGVPQLLRYVAKLYERLLTQSQEVLAEQTKIYSPLVDLLDGRLPPEDSVLRLCRKLNWNESTPLVLYKISSIGPERDGVVFDWLCSAVSVIIAKFPRVAAITYQNAVVAVVGGNPEHAQTLLDDISGAISRLAVGEYRCGVSFTFTGLDNIRSYYEQAGSAIELAEGAGIARYFEDCVYTSLINAFKTCADWRSWILPSLLGLIESDRELGAQYYKTLYHLLLNQGRMGDTAKALFIHRNTLAYRLEKLQQLLNVDLRDERTLAYLRFCYSLLAEDYPAG
jgi:hypothetical protein